MPEDTPEVEPRLESLADGDVRRCRSVLIWIAVASALPELETAPSIVIADILRKAIRWFLIEKHNRMRDRRFCAFEVRNMLLVFWQRCERSTASVAEFSSGMDSFVVLVFDLNTHAIPPRDRIARYAFEPKPPHHAMASIASSQKWRLGPSPRPLTGHTIG